MKSFKACVGAIQIRMEWTMNEVRTCTKCSGRMAKATAEIFGSVFGCTREPKYQEVLRGEKIQSYYCEDCGYIEFYREKNE